MQISGNESYSISSLNSAINPLNSSNSGFQSISPELSEDALVLGSGFNVDNNSSESLDLNFQDLYKSLTIASKQIVDKLNEILKNKLPNGLQSLKAEDVTPEASADSVVKGVTSLFSAFAKQNQDLKPEELVKKFIEEAKKGVEQGYGDAKEVLTSLGALEINGVEDGISKTKDLILQKLDKFAELKLEELSGKTPTSSQSAEFTKVAVLQQSAGKLLDLAA